MDDENPETLKPAIFITAKPISKSIFISFFSLLIGFALGFFIGKESPIPTLLTNLPQSTTTPTPTTSTAVSANQQNPAAGIIAKSSDIFSVRGLHFKIPVGWWINTTANIYFGDSWVFINPSIPEIPNDSIFIIKSVSGKFEPTLDYKNYLKITQNDTFNISGTKGEMLIGLATPPTGSDITCPECYLGRYKTGEKVFLSVIKKDNNYYSFEGHANTSENEYKQILSSFSFSPIQ